MWQQAEAYPDPRVEVLDPRFLKYRIGNAAVERLATGFRFTEGPVWFGDLRCLLFSDIPENRMLRWDEETGAVATFRRPSGYANGNTRDRQGRLVTCEHGTRRVSRTEHDGGVTVLIERFDGRRLNSPNDVVVKSDDSIWFTDPDFGITSDYEGRIAPSEISTNVYRLDPRTGRAAIVLDDVQNPNGLCFSPDESKLYVVESGSAPQRIRVYDVEDGARLVRGRVFIEDDHAAPDGVRCDADGNVWAGWGPGADRNGVLVIAPDGTPIGRVALPERCANLAFGGAAHNRLFMTAGQSLYALYTNARAAIVR